MNVRFGHKVARIHPYDAFKLKAMTQAVLQDRPSFGLVRADLDGEPVSVFTRRLGTRQHRSSREALVLLGPRQRLELSSQDTAGLEQLLSDTGQN